MSHDIIFDGGHSQHDSNLYLVDQHARELAYAMDQGYFEEAARTLLNDANRYGPQLFQELVNATNRYERDGIGADLVLTPLDNNQPFRPRHGGNNYYERDYLVSVVKPEYRRDRFGWQNNWQNNWSLPQHGYHQPSSYLWSDIAVMRTGLRPLDGRLRRTR